MSERHFTIVSMKSGGKSVFSGGRFTGEAAAAAKKAVSSYAKEKGVKTVSVIVHVRETTQESNHREFHYKVVRSKLDKPVTSTHRMKSQKSGKTKEVSITHRYKTTCKKVKV